MPVPTATILNYQRLSTEDGPGIRTTVFFKGCPLNCQWCHNPESISSKLQIQWFSSRCIGCNSCMDICEQEALQRVDQNLIIDRNICNLCGFCAEACPANALELIGKKVTVDQVLEEVLKDSTYYQKSQGGVTLSGGEPILQSKFVIKTMQILREKNIHLALDTCGLFNYQILESIYPLVDLILYDIKMIDPQLHQQFTGQSNYLILENLSNVICHLEQFPGQFDLWIRTPLIPGSTATKENLQAIANFLISIGINQISRWELCAFNNLCKDKYDRLEIEWLYKNQSLMTREELEQCHQWVIETGFSPEKVRVSGATRVEKKHEEEGAII